MVCWSLPLKGEQQQSLVQACAQGGKLLVFPTETYYALGCRADDEIAVERVYQLKARQKTEPLLVLVDGWEQLRAWAFFREEAEAAAARSYWPGPLTLILPVKPGLAAGLNQGGKELAFRMTADPQAQALIRLCGVPLVGTSANRSGAAPQREIAPILRDWGEEVDFYLDGGQTPGGPPSSLARWSGQGWKILRQGAVHLE